MKERRSVKEQYFIDKSKIDDNDARQVEYLLEFEKEHNDEW